MACHPSLLRSVFSVFLVCFLSCTRAPKEDSPAPSGRPLDHNFEPGKADNLYKVRDLLKKWDQKPESSKAPSQSAAPVSLSVPAGDLYAKGVFRDTVSHTDSLLRVRTVSKGEKVKVSFVQENIFY